jgi:C4-type Zn-finger protein
MSDDMRKLADSVDAKLRQKGAKYECPICTNATWYLIGNQARPTIVPFATPLDSIETYTFACQNCGFIRQHVQVVVDGDLEQIDEERHP